MKTMKGGLVESGGQSNLLKRLGVGGFLFFLVKGLLWLTVPAVLAVVGAS